MRRLFVCVVVASCWGLVVGQAIASASNSSTAPAVDPGRSYWIEAQKLAQNHLILLNRIEQALSSPNANRVRAMKGQIFLQTSAVDRFLKSSYPAPEVLCASNLPNGGIGSVAGTDAISLEEGQVYCALYASARELQPLRAQLERRVGMVIKSSIETNPPVMPAIQPLEELLEIVRSSRNRLVQVQSAFPVTVRFTVPPHVMQSERSPYNVPSQELQPYTSFLSQPNTGMARLLSIEAYRTASSLLDNRFASTVAEQLPFAVLVQRAHGLSPRLAIGVEGDTFQIMQTDLDYGFMTDLGEAAIETLMPSDQKLSNLPAALQFFYSYRPPSELEAIQADRRRFTAGTSDSRLTLPLLGQATATLNRTYLVRSIQFQVPEVITSGRSLLPRERFFLKDLLTTPSSDLLFAFRPVSRHADGSYTVLWKILTQFSDPQIRDLARYVVR